MGDVSNKKEMLYGILVRKRNYVISVISRRLRACELVSVVLSLWVSILLLAIFKPLNFLSVGSGVKDIFHILIGLIPSGVCFGACESLLRKKYVVNEDFTGKNLQNDKLLSLLFRKDQDFARIIKELTDSERADLEVENSAVHISPQTVFSSIPRHSSEPVSLYRTSKRR